MAKTRLLVLVASEFRRIGFLAASYAEGVSLLNMATNLDPWESA